MADAALLRKFKRFASLFLEFESDYNAMSHADQTMFTVELRKEEFKALWSKVKTAYEKYSVDGEGSEEEDIEANLLFKQCREAYICCAAQMGEMSQNFASRSVLTSTMHPTNHNFSQPLEGNRFSDHRMRLPPCTTEVFYGDYLSWPSFRDMFTAVYINCPSITLVEKLFYLRQNTQGEALEIVKKSQLTNEGFEIAWNNLKDRYENKRILVNSQLKVLFNLVSVRTESAQEIKRLQREINNCKSSLELHKINIDSWDPIFVYLCSTKLPTVTLSLWEQTVKDKTEISKWSDLDSFLTSRFQFLETVFDLTHTNSINQHERLESTVTRPNKRVTSYQTKVKTNSCYVCAQEHYLRYCPTFLRMNQEERFDAVKRHNLCLNCFSSNHKLGQCASNFSCSKCNMKHHSLLHKDSRKTTQMSNEIVPDIPSTSQQAAQNVCSERNVQNCFTIVNKQVLLGTAIVNIVANGVIYTARALIDSGSQATFISEKLRRRLNLPSTRINAIVSGLNKALAGSTQELCNFIIRSPANPNFEIEVSGLVLPQLTGRLPSSTIRFPISYSFENLRLADPNFAQSGNVDILIGGDIYPQILLEGVRKNILDSLIAQNTIFGWVLTGPLQDCSLNSSTTYVSFCTEVSLDKQLEKFWKLEEIPQASITRPEDEYCEEFYQKTTKRLMNGRFMVSLPFKPQFLNGKGLGLSRQRACRQFFRNETSLIRKPHLKSIYDDVLCEYEALGHMRRIEQTKESDISIFLPHHAVFKPESSSTKVRVVFNASSPTSTGISLNDTLYTGPVLQNDLVILILKWRFYRYVFNGDIEKMYRQIYLDEGHTRFQRIIFRKNPNEDIHDFELKTVTFGINCAPFLAIRTLLQLATDVEKELPLAAKILREMMYVDDALAGAHDIDLAIQARDQLIAALSSAGFSMRKWTANNENILKGLPPDHLHNEKFLEMEDESRIKTLGIRWNAKRDCFYFVVKPLKQKPNYTKREVLSAIASLFDPAGWLGPVIVVAKILMQQIWSDKTKWDECLSKQSDARWNQFISDYEFLNNIQLPRWIGFTPESILEIHGFADASEKAYGACVYARVVSVNGRIQTQLLLAKSRVAPLKTISLPRLELCGALLLANLMKTVNSELGLSRKDTKFYCWSDSKIVLAWIQKPPCSWATFVANRVSRIIDKVGKRNWRHVRSECNPADSLSRGIRPQDLADNSLWWHGPSWLHSESRDWEVVSEIDFHTEEEVRKIQTFFSYVDNFDDILLRFSSYSKALRVMAYVYRFIDRTRRLKREYSRTTHISTTEFTTVKERLIVLAQKVFFPDEYHQLSEKETIRSSSRLRSLYPFIDANGIIRVGGRLSHANALSFNEQHPIILPYGCNLSKLLVTFIHQVTLHGGNQLMMRVLRTEMWIPRSKNLIKSIVGRCRICTVMAKKNREQLMASLPLSRTLMDRPFTRTGVDFAGPYDIKNYTGRACLITKGYVCLFVCFATRAIHLEAVSDLSSNTFLAAFARFSSRRGCPKDMYSDNGTNFVGASKSLKTEFRAFFKTAHSEINLKYTHLGLNWHFNPAAAPHMGGLWEAGVKSFKHHFRRIAGNLKYTFEEFSTLLARIEACLNSRPLCPLTDDVSCIDALTPGHFLVGGPILAPPEIVIDESPLTIVNRWQRVKALNQRLCMRWKEEYLKEMVKRNKWRAPEANLEVNDMVVIKDDNLPPNEWRLGRVIKVIPGLDKQVRVAEVKTERGTIIRPIVKLVVLPVD